VESLIAALPDFRFEVHDWMVDGDRIAARCSAVGTHRGELFGFAPTGRRVSWTSIHIWRVADGRLTDRWSEADLLGIVEQLKPDQG
jgi:predicted ester cyclase